MARFVRRPPRREGPPINERCLKFRDVRLIGAEGEQVGIVQSRQALAMAKEAGLDLLLVSDSANPPVCRIIDYGKHKYETEKLKKENKRKQQDVKGIKMRPGTAQHDLETLERNTRRFIAEGHKVKVMCQFRRRETSHPEIGHKKMLAFAEKLADVAMPEREPRLDGNVMSMTLLPKPGSGGKKNAKAEDEQNGG